MKKPQVFWSNLSLINLRSSNLFEQVLVAPYSLDQADELIVIAGYASPRMLAQHLQTILELDKPGTFKLQLVVGMNGASNLSDGSYSAFRALSLETAKFSCSILTPKGNINVHSKAYVWLLNGEPISAWAGSANYSRLAFGLSPESDSRDEIMVRTDPDALFDYAQRVLANSVSLTDNGTRVTLPAPVEIEKLSNDATFLLPETLPREKFAICPLVNTRTKEVHNAGAGLNWGQPTETRHRSDKSAAYLPVPVEFRDFFPPSGEIFEAFCPDGQVLLLARGQQDGKAISTPASNEILGMFFRALLGVGPGVAVRTADLNLYGSNCVVFEKVDQSSFNLHFYPGLDLNEMSNRLV